MNGIDPILNHCESLKFDTIRNGLRKSLLYPLPDQELKSLGVHSTNDVTGAIKLGPNAIPVENADYDFPDSIKEQMTAEILKTFKNIVQT